MEIVSNIALISINETAIAQLAAFLLFVFVINRIMFKPLRRTMAEREEAINGIKGEIDRAKLEFETVTAAAKERETAIKTDAFRVKESLEAGAKEQAATVLAAATREMDSIRKQAEQDVEKMIEGARRNIAEESERLSVSIMEKILERRLA